MKKSYQLFFYVPASHAREVKQAIFKAGAGQLGNYSNCCWQTTGSGQYLPSEAASPFVGEKGELCIEEEIKIEVLCFADKINKVLMALKNAHPYEEPAFGVIELFELASP